MTRRLLPFICSLFVGQSAMASDPIENAYYFDFENIAGEKISLSDYKGNVLLVVNTASECGFTDQYAGLQKLYDDYKDRGLMVIGVPSNDFGGQEPGSNEEIKDFCETTFRITFPLMAKTAVTGDNAHPFYAWARSNAGVLGAPKWNFHKYLIGPDGRYVDYFNSTTSPQSDSIRQAIETLLETKS